MEFKFFTDLIDALGKVADGFKAITNLTKAERDKYRETLKETFLLIDTTLNMVIIRLNDVLHQSTDVDFMREATTFDYIPSWLNAEREFRLCHSLRVALRETQTISGKLTGFISTNDWDILLKQMQDILSTENAVADFITQKFQALAHGGRAAGANPQTITILREQIEAFLQQVNEERRKLMKQEIGLYEVV